MRPCGFQARSLSEQPPGDRRQDFGELFYVTAVLGFFFLPLSARRQTAATQAIGCA